MEIMSWFFLYLLTFMLLIGALNLLYLYYSYGKMFENTLFGIPVVARLSGISSGYHLHRAFMDLINPFLMQNTEDTIDEYDKDDDVTIKLNEDDELGETTSSPGIGGGAVSNSETEDGTHLWTDFEFYLFGGIGNENVKIALNEPLPVQTLPGKLEVVVLWSDEMIKKYDTNLLDLLPEVFKPQLFSKRTQESISIYKCLEAFLREEPLGPEDMWLVDIYIYIII